MNRLTIVSGKGGVGKTTVATALALASAADGERTVLVSLEGTGDLHPVFGVPFAFEPTQVAQAQGSLELLRLEAVPAVREYVRRRLPLGRLYDGVFESRAFKDFVSATPGFEELMVLGKLYDLITTGSAKEIIFDAPASGHLCQLLKVPAATKAAVRFGPMFDIARKIEGRLRDAATTRILLPVLPEAMPLRETQELAAFVKAELGLSARLLLNRVLDAPLSAAELAQLEAVAASDAAQWLCHCRNLAERSASEADALGAMAEVFARGTFAGGASALPRLPQLTPVATMQAAGNADTWAFGCNLSVAQALVPFLRAALAGQWS